MTNLVFLDLETTGLNPRLEKILEFGIVIYDAVEKKIVAERNWVLRATSIDKDECIEFIQEMHRRNGLWEECFVSQLKLDQVSLEAREWLAQYIGEKPPMCGNTIGYFDKVWIEYHMPKLGEIFSYRSIDISGLNELAKLGLIPGLEKSAPKGDAHRALDDCRSSIAQLEYYLDHWQHLWDFYCSVAYVPKTNDEALYQTEPWTQ